MSPTEQLLEIAKGKLGTDFTEDRIVPDEVSCAFALTTVLHEQDSRVPIMEGTYTLESYLKTSPLFEQIFEPEAGCIVVCATGTNNRPQIIPNGHTGLYLDNDKIVSNDSASGLWLQNYTRESWRQRYYYRGGYSVRLFRKIA